MKKMFRFCFCLCFLVSPGLSQVPKPAECLVSGVYDLIRVPESKDYQSCYIDCSRAPNCHMAVLSQPMCGKSQCLLVNCLNQGQFSLRRDPSATISVYPKATIDKEQRALLMEDTYGRANEKLQCSGIRKENICKLKTPRFFFNVKTRNCEPDTSGCGTIRNTFKTRGECMDFCNRRHVCFLPVEYGARPPVRFSKPDPGRGKPEESAPHNFFFHNISSFKCEGFHFRGSLSNGNIFDTEEECGNVCGDVKVRCLDFMEDRNREPRFFYNSTSYRCEPVPRGFGSNRNTFATREGCEALCNEQYRCYRPVEYGRRPSMRFSQESTEPHKPSRKTPHNFFYYNVEKLRCEGFYFRGSGSNGNIFSTEKECEQLCDTVKGVIIKG